MLPVDRPQAKGPSPVRCPGHKAFVFVQPNPVLP